MIVRCDAQAAREKLDAEEARETAALVNHISKEKVKNAHHCMCQSASSYYSPPKSSCREGPRSQAPNTQGRKRASPPDSSRLFIAVSPTWISNSCVIFCYNNTNPDMARKHQSNPVDTRRSAFMLDGGQVVSTWGESMSLLLILQSRNTNGSACPTEVPSVRAVRLGEWHPNCTLRTNEDISGSKESPIAILRAPISVRNYEVERHRLLHHSFTLRKEEQFTRRAIIRR